ncbi:Unknown protein [Striga hermonthica]|uniref:Uncharacterized protein n=1 Tax=Striga hermonthica TaxID=68872 RepID=A0A9N7N3Z3_STRHE|nr:Unknown protein [Striga hermonthica]
MNRTRSKDEAVDGQSRNVDRKRRMDRPRFPGLGASFLLPFLLTGRGPDPHKGGGSRLNISAIGGNFARIRSPILVHPG